MDKKVWTKPEVSVVEFEANEYVAACTITPASETWNHINSSWMADKSGLWLYLETANSSSTTNNSNSLTVDFSESIGSRHAMNSGYEYNENFFSNVLAMNDTAIHNFDQWIPYPSEYVDQYSPCDNSSGVVDEDTISTAYDGWWSTDYNSVDPSKTGKAKLWWTDRLHAAFYNYTPASANHSA